MFVVKRKTIEVYLTARNITADKILLGYSPTGFINTELFNFWVSKSLKPHIEAARKKHNYDGPGIVIMEAARVTPVKN